MAKHDVIIKNLMALTRTRSFNAAVKGWEVKNVVSLPEWQTQACELCGTRFRQGARIYYPKTKATILVDGTCLETIRKSHFPLTFDFARAKQQTHRTLVGLYGDLTDPGNWLKWLLDNTPRRLAPLLADLQLFGALPSRKELDDLIQFHDKKRRFRRTALLPNARTLEVILRIKIPYEITIEQARKIQARFERKPTRVRVPANARAYAARILQPSMKADPDLNALWATLTQTEKRAVAAIAALDERAAREDSVLCSPAMATAWPSARRGPMFVWNSKVGLGFVGAEDRVDDHKAHVWIWRSRKYGENAFDLQFWRGVAGCSAESVDLMENLAFSS